MRPRFDRFAAWALTCAGATGATEAQAGESAPVTIEFLAPSGCPAAADFQQRVQSRVSHFRVARPGEPARHVHVVIEPAAEGRVRGSLVVAELDGRSAERTVTAPDCRQAAEALALVVALAIDGQAMDESDRVAPTPTAPTPPPPAPTHAATAAYEAPASASHRTTWAFDASAGSLSAVGMAPGPLVGFAALAGVALIRLPPPWVPRLWVGFVGALPRSFPGPNGTASFATYSAIAEVSPVEGHISSRVSVRPCLVGEYGIVAATGADTVAPRSESRPWAAIGLEGRIDVRLVGPFSVGAAVGVLAPLVRDRFVIAGMSVFEVPYVVGQATLGLGMSLPQ